MVYGTGHTYSNSDKNENRTFLNPSFAVQCTCKGGFAMRVEDVEHKVKLDDFKHRVLIACVNSARMVFIGSTIIRYE